MKFWEAAKDAVAIPAAVSWVTDYNTFDDQALKLCINKLDNHTFGLYLTFDNPTLKL